MKYVYMFLVAVVCYLGAQFASGFAVGLFETVRYTDHIMFEFGAVCGVVLMSIQWFYDKKRKTNDK